MRLIKGGNKPKKYRSKTDDEPIICAECGDSTFIEVISQPKRNKLKWLKRSGSRYLICLTCRTQATD